MPSLLSGGIPVLGNPGTGVGVGVGVALGVEGGVGVMLGVGVTLGVGVGVGVALGVGVGVEIEHVGTVIVSPTAVVTVPPKAKALPFHVTLLPNVIPAALISVPANVELAPSVVAATGVQNTSQDDAPLVSETLELATEVRAPVILKT